MTSVDTLNSIIKTILSTKVNNSLSQDKINRLISGIFSYRNLEYLAISSPHHFFETLFSSSHGYGKIMFPFDPLELREILESKMICVNMPLILFSSEAVEKLVSSYKCFLILDQTKLENFINIGGCFLFDDCHVNIDNAILGIKVFKNGPESQIRQIANSIDNSISVYNHYTAPGMNVQKVAQVKTKNKKYIVDLTPLKIYEEIVAENEVEALRRALALRWDRHPDSKEKRKPARYSAEYWMHSGFWKEIVKEANSTKSYKKAQVDATMPTIQLTPEEQQVFSTILSIDKEFNLGQQYRIAGGWVRDRLLGTQSDDIDIALDKMTGQQFKKYADQYAANHPESGIGKSYVVDQNPDASKHLETTAIQFGPFKIDFVNLRTEDYASDSRIPTMKPGTPQEDASRRDLTINSLFYNIGTGQVEDYVGGLNDLKTMTLRTPLDSTQTFMDDPLRILRVLRFNSRYKGSKISPETLQGMSNPAVHEAYRKKVSPERAGPEIMKMFNGSNPEESVRILYQTGMDAALLNLPDFQNLHPSNMDQRNPNHQLNWLDHTLKVMQNLNTILSQQQVSGKDRALALMASWFHDFGKLHPEIGKPKDDNPDHMTYHGHEDVSAQLSESFLKSIGIGSDDRQIVNMIVKEHMVPHSHGKDWNKRQMGKFRQKTTIPGKEDRSDLWKFVMWHSQADAAAKSETSQIQDFPEYVDRFTQMNDYMNAPPPVKPLVDGKRLIELFPTLSPKSGFIKEINMLLLDEQGAGNITNNIEAENYVESIRQTIESKYGGGQIMASNWYKKVKADASSASQTDGYMAQSVSSEPEALRHKDQKKMIYYSPGTNSKYQVGDRVRRRQGGVVFLKSEGKVVRKKENKIVVRWDGGDETEFDINDIETTALIERI